MSTPPRYPLNPWNPHHPLYAAEKAAMPFGLPFHDIDHVADYLSRILSSDWWQEEWPEVTEVWIVEGDNEQWAETLGNEIKLPPFAMNETYVLHELAHVAADDEEDPDGDGHGLAFRHAEVIIVRHMMGDWVADNLIAWFERTGVPL